MSVLNIPEFLSQPFTSKAWMTRVSVWGMPERCEYAELQILDYLNHGVQLYVNKHGNVVTIFLFATGVEDHRESELPLPYDLKFFHSADAVEHILGAPNQTGVNEKGFRWFKYSLQNHSVHIEFSYGSNQIRLVTVMADEREIIGE